MYVASHFLFTFSKLYFFLYNGLVFAVHSSCSGLSKKLTSATHIFCLTKNSRNRTWSDLYELQARRKQEGGPPHFQISADICVGKRKSFPFNKIANSTNPFRFSKLPTALSWDIFSAQNVKNFAHTWLWCKSRSVQKSAFSFLLCYKKKMVFW